MNRLDLDYQALLKDILDNGVKKADRTGTGTLSVFGRTIKHKMTDGFPLLTSKRVNFNLIVSELLWFLNGDTSLKSLLEKNNHIWSGDAYKAYLNKVKRLKEKGLPISMTNTEEEWKILNIKEFEKKILTDAQFAKSFGDLGPIYGKQWRNWEGRFHAMGDASYFDDHDQIAELIEKLKKNPDDRGLIVSAWNVSSLKHMSLRPCHYSFQVYTRELSLEERDQYNINVNNSTQFNNHSDLDNLEIPRRAISLIFNMRSSDVCLGLPFNIASYGLLLTILGKIVNMIPEELIGNLGDTHIYLDHIEGAKEQLGREMNQEERIHAWFHTQKPNRDTVDYLDTLSSLEKDFMLDTCKAHTKTREPFDLPKLQINKTDDFWKSFNDSLFSHLDVDDFKILNYNSHPSIKFPLSN